MARVMIAEDSSATREILRDSLEIGRHEIVAEATDGFETIEKYIATNPDVLLLDVSMPRKDGMSALREIMSSKPDAKIIMITADDDLSTIHQSSAAGAQAYLVKPFSSDEVLTAITMALN
jgi:two-component system chemotaxis response regulator CheY